MHQEPLLMATNDRFTEGRASEQHHLSNKSHQYIYLLYLHSTWKNKDSGYIKTSYRTFVLFNRPY